jgi:A/G-specific adenine glycosylase
LLKEYDGRLPSTYEELLKIKGIGPYTAGAILNFAFQIPYPALDGNVIRVLSRYLAEEDEVDLPKTQNKLRSFLFDFLPKAEGWIISEALIELGALVCQKKPDCSSCPLKKECVAFRDQRQYEFPKKKARVQAVQLQRCVAVIECEKRYLVCKGESGKVMQDLYQFPFIEESIDCPKRLTEAFSKSLSLSLEYVKPLKSQRHTFTKYRVELYPHFFVSTTPALGEWLTKEEMLAAAFSSGHKRILDCL